MRRAVLGLTLASVAALAAADTKLLVVSGLGGEETYSQAFLEAATRLYDAAVRNGVPASEIWLLAENPEADPDRIRAKSSRDEVLAALREMASGSEEGDELWVVLIGHGSQRGGRSTINLPGPDLSDGEFAAALAGLDGRTIVFVNAASSSGGFIGALSGPDRVVVTATRSAAQRNESRFAGHFVAALSGADADADLDGRVSVLEAFDYAVREVTRHYETEKLLRTEHALLDDNGDGEGSLEPKVLGGEDGSGDGLLAARLFLGQARGTGTAPGSEELVERRAEIQRRLDELRRQKASLSQEVYEQELERLLLELARVDRELRSRAGAGEPQPNGEPPGQPPAEPPGAPDGSGGRGASGGPLP